MGMRYTGDKKMKIINTQNDIVSSSGSVKLCAFTPGLIPKLMQSGMNLREAMATAKEKGDLHHVVETHNVITTVGRQLLARRMSGQETVGLAYMAIGTGTTTPVISNTQLGSESLRKVFTECYQGDVYLYSSVFFLASECSFFIKEGGLFGGAAAIASANTGSLFCRFLVGEDNSVNRFDLSIQHTTEFNL